MIRKAAGWLRKTRRTMLLPILALGVSVLLSSCSLINPSRPDTLESRLQAMQDAAQNPVDKHSLVQDLITCITDNRKTSSVYDSIPAVQRKNISAADFEAYIRVLSRMLTERGQITSYRFLGDEERNTLLEGIAESTGPYQDLLKDTLPVELLFDNEESIHQSVYVYIHESSNGMAYLSDKWINDSMEIFNLASLYFSALEGKNQVVVSTLIEAGTSEKDFSLSSQVLDRKAEKLMTYYHVNVKTQFVDYRLESFDITKAVFLQKEVLDDNSLSYRSQRVLFQRNSSLVIGIHDNVRDNLDTRHFYLCLNGERTIRIGDRADSKQFTELFGEPLYIGQSFSKGKYQQIEDQGRSDRLFVISYNGMSVTIFGNIYDDGSWDGRIIRIRLRRDQQEFSIGTDIRTLDIRDDILMLYPFADELDYLLTTEIDDNQYELRFVFSEEDMNQVTGVILELNPEKS